MPDAHRSRRSAGRPCASCAVAALVAALGCAEHAADVTVGAVDYAFRVPDTLAAGVTTFHLRNAGTVRHEMVLGELKAGIRPESAYAVETRNGDISTVYEHDAALLTANPGETPDFGLRATLVKGRTYVFLCGLQDAPDKPPHLLLGMYKPFVVK